MFQMAEKVRKLKENVVRAYQNARLQKGAPGYIETREEAQAREKKETFMNLDDDQISDLTAAARQELIE